MRTWSNSSRSLENLAVKAGASEHVRHHGPWNVAQIDPAGQVGPEPDELHRALDGLVELIQGPLGVHVPGLGVQLVVDVGHGDVRDRHEEGRGVRRGDNLRGA
jgi:hypothetical protein